MSDFMNLKFKRLFAFNMYKNKRILLAGMSFDKDFVNDTRGDMYPVIECGGEFCERVEYGKYSFSSNGDSGYIARMLCRHFPYASYCISASLTHGECGILIKSKNASRRIIFASEDSLLSVSCGEERLVTEYHINKIKSFTITSRKECFDIYVNTGVSQNYVCSFTLPEFSDMAREDVFKETITALYLCGNVEVFLAEGFIDCGISQADIRPIRYENGDIMLDGGRVYLTASVRMQEGCYQGIFSWVPGTCEFEMTGALFFDTGDGVWSNDVASSLIYHRGERKWLLWVCSFSHGHILAHARFDGDVRHGVSVVDVTLMKKMTADDPDTVFLGKEGDEDPDFIYDEEKKKWYMAICRVVLDENGKKNYRYFLFESNRPFEGYKHIANSTSGSETGGSIIKENGKYYLLCGNSFTERASYRCYSLPDMDRYSPLVHDYDDGGFRGWGSVIPIKKGTRTVYYHLTFDRHKGSSYNWSYGNIYCFIAE